MLQIGVLTLILANAWVTYKGLKEERYFDRFSFKISSVTTLKDYKRLITSGFLHVDWRHFIFNMLTLCFFGFNLESSVGFFPFMMIYFMSLIGGSVLSLWIHKNKIEYIAVGASGAVCGVVFASIALFPGLHMSFLILPVSFPAWLFGIVYVMYTIYGIRNQVGPIAHEAHLGGGVLGMLVAILLKPQVLSVNYFPVLLILVPSILFIYIVVKNPHLLLISNPFTSAKGDLTIDDIYNTEKASKEKELDQLLEKIHQKGYDRLSKKEKKRLEELSK